LFATALSGSAPDARERTEEKTMNSRALSVAAVVAQLVMGGALAHAHQGHEIDRELLAAKIRESGHTCPSVTEASEKSENPTVMAVQCGADLQYRLVITKTRFEVTPAAANATKPPSNEPPIPAP
jgi:hypothetical protein